MGAGLFTASVMVSRLKEIDPAVVGQIDDAVFLTQTTRPSPLLQVF